MCSATPSIANLGALLWVPIGSELVLENMRLPNLEVPGCSCTKIYSEALGPILMIPASYPAST